MKVISKILAGLAVVTAAGVLLKVYSKSKTKKRLNRIADEGYETADDILFPGKTRVDKQLHYGPVLPA
jgi:hypothetical protein